MYIGQKVDSHKLEGLLEKLAPHIEEDENVLGVVVCNNFRPFADRLIATDRQLIALSASDGIPKWHCPYSMLLQIESDTKRDKISVHTAGGEDRVFKMVSAQDHRPLLKIVAERHELFLPTATFGQSPPAPGSNPYEVAAPRLPSVPEPPKAALPLGDSGVKEHLARLTELRDAGVLTAEEFATVHARLLAQRR